MISVTLRIIALRVGTCDNPTHYGFGSSLIEIFLQILIQVDF